MPLNYDKEYFQGHYEAAPTLQPRAKTFAILGKDAFNRYVTKTEKPKALDIGCAYGYFLGFLDNFDFETFGIDVSTYAIAQSARFTTAKTLACDPQAGLPFKENTFDLVTMFSLLAHLEMPVRTFNEIHRVLKPSGILILVTANTISLERFLLRKKWDGLAYDHILLYTPFTLRFALQRANFNVLEVKTPQVYPFFTFHNFTLPKRILKIMLNLPFGGYIWAVARRAEDE
jgi:SAM-dependent methyltransferase